MYIKIVPLFNKLRCMIKLSHYQISVKNLANIDRDVQAFYFEAGKMRGFKVFPEVFQYTKNKGFQG